MKLEQCLDVLYGSDKKARIDPSTIPCIEKSDKLLLCKNPLASIRVVTYNHETYIRECLDSVVCQETDFEYEIVIGEDCSQDNTREICFEYQRQYPEKVRVLWANENVYCKGGNQARTAFHCRGEYIALIEGDDYWTDRGKLQKQIDLIRQTGAICCIANYDTKNFDGTIDKTRYSPRNAPYFGQGDMFHCYPHTSTYVIRRNLYMTWRRRFSGLHASYDVMLMHCLISIGRVVMLTDAVSVYRLTGSGIATGLTYQEKRLLGIKQYLDLYLHGPREVKRRFGSMALTYAAFFYDRSKEGWSYDFAKKYTPLITQIFLGIFSRQFWHLRTIRAALRFLRFKYIDR